MRVTGCSQRLTGKPGDLRLLCEWKVGWGDIHISISQKIEWGRWFSVYCVILYDVAVSTSDNAQVRCRYRIKHLFRTRAGKTPGVHACARAVACVS